MSVIVKVIGHENDTDEYRAALYLQRALNDTMPANANGDIILYPSATLWGQNVKDIDLLMVGQLDSCEIKLSFNDKKEITDNVKIENFCIPIEIKSHSVDGIIRRGTDWLVKYSTREHNVTRQSNEQKISVMRFFENTLQTSMYVTNLIWFMEISRSELDALLSVSGKKIISNVLSRDITFKEIMQLILWQKRPFKVGNRYVFNASFEGCDIGRIQKSLTFFSKEKSGLGELTRKKVEMITNSDFRDKLIVKSESDTISIYRGRAGTGKTVGLIQTAIHLVDEEEARVLLLTYNKALVSDIRRLFALADLPDMFEIKCVAINTMHSYFFKLINVCMYDGKLYGDTFLNNYDKYLKELLDFISQDADALGIIKDECKEEPELNWDYVFIDEAQDWSEAERDIILKLFNNKNILVADGGQQYVRNVQPCDWSIVRDRTNIRLKKCLRQKSNLIKFVNHFSETFELSTNRIIGSDKMIGGKIIIVTEEDRIIPTIISEYNKMSNNGNIAYDMMVFTTGNKLKWNDGVKEFEYTEKLKRNNINVWDGTVSESRFDTIATSDEIRVLRYESGRGLEAWCVVCLDFDVFLNEKREQFNPNTKVDELMLESKEEKLEKYLLNWGMIPITRAIDALIITIKDINSDISKKLKKIALDNSDYIDWI